MTLEEIQNETDEIRTKIRKLNKRSEQLFLLKVKEEERINGQLEFDGILN